MKIGDGVGVGVGVGGGGGYGRGGGVCSGGDDGSGGLGVDRDTFGGAALTISIAQMLPQSTQF